MRLDHLVTRGGAQGVVNRSVTIRVGRDPIARIQRGSSRWDKSHLDAGYWPPRRIGHLRHQRTGEGLTHRGDLVVSVECRYSGGLAISGEEQIVAAAGGQDEQG
jgi:hypothetical protein